MRVILGSSSPRRKELLSLITSDFEVIKPSFEEKQKEGEKALDYAMRNSISKAESILKDLGEVRDTLIISSDTIGLLNERVFEKPRSEAQAFEMLRSLSGSTHQIITSFSIIYMDSQAQKNLHSENVVTEVTFTDLSDEMISSYIKTGEPMDKAGAYGIQAGAAGFVETISGSYTNVVGLPVAQLRRAIGKLCKIKN